MWMRKGVVGKRNKKLEKLKRKINTMLSWMRKGVAEKGNKKFRKNKRKENRMWWGGRKRCR